MSKIDLKQRAANRRKLANTTAHVAATQKNLEDRAKARRAYMQGGPGGNDPKNLGFPGELQYKPMDVPVGGDSRQWEQGWFEGAAAETAKEMGPAGKELELKKKIQRASDALRALDKIAATNPSEVRAKAAVIANDLNTIVTELDKAGRIKQAEAADGILEQIAEYLAKPEEKAEEEEEDEEKDCWASAKPELMLLANVLDGKGFTKEADEIDEILSLI